MRITKKFYAAAASLVVAVGAIVALNVTGVTGQAISSFRNCNADAIITCGALSQSELLGYYDKNVGDVKNVYSHYGIGRGDIAGTTSEVRVGTVYQDGRVVVDGKTVATGAYSLSRVKYTSQGEPKTVVINGKTYYQGPSMRIFTGPVDAFVMFRNGTFYAAVLSSCSNPLIAVPVKPEPKPEYACNSLSATKIDRTRFSFTSSATAKNGAEIVSYNYDFGDGNKTTGGATVEHTYARPGTYNVTMTVNVRVDGQIQVVPGANCKTTIKVDEEQKEPAYRCDSLVATKINRTTYQFKANATAENGATIESYTFNFGDGQFITNTANSQVTHTYAAAGNYTAFVNVNFKVNGETKSASGPNCKVTIKVDEEPKQPVYKCDSLTAQKLARDQYRFNASATAENGATIESYTYNFGDGSANQTTSSRTVEHTYAEAGNYTATLTVNFKVNGQNKSETGPNCKVNIKVDEEQKEPVYKCVSLKANKINRTEFRFTTEATAEHGAKIVSYAYDFGDGSKTTTAQSSVPHEYDEPGDYTIKVTVNFDVNGEAKAITSPNCKTTITVDEEPEKPAYKCESLTARLIKDRTYEFTLAYQADGGAELDRVVYNFGDSVSETFLPAEATSVEHTYAQPGIYKITTTLYFNVPEEGETVEESDTCEEEITISEEPCSVPGKEHLPKDSPDCKEDEKCPIPGKEHLPKDSPDCVEPPCEIPGKEHLPKDSPDCVETPPELPKTGLDMMIGGGLGLGSLSAAVYYYGSSRRNLLNVLNNK